MWPLAWTGATRPKLSMRPRVAFGSGGISVVASFSIALVKAEPGAAVTSASPLAAAL